MSKLIKAKIHDETSVLIEVAENARLPESLIVESGVTEKVEKFLDKMLYAIKPYSETIIRTFQSLSDEVRPDSASAEFGLSFVGEGNVFLAKASAEASIRVTLKWQLKP